MSSKTLKVVTRADCHVNKPGSVRVPGNPPEYVGRTFDPKTGTHPANEKPEEYPADHPSAKRIKKLVARGELLPADAATAALCGVEFAPPVKDAPKAEAKAAPKPEALEAPKPQAEPTGPRK